MSHVSGWLVIISHALVHLFLKKCRTHDGKGAYFNPLLVKALAE